MAVTASSPNLTFAEIDALNRMSQLAALITSEAPANSTFIPLHQQLLIELQRELVYSLLARGRLDPATLLALFAVTPANSSLMPGELQQTNQVAAITAALPFEPLLKLAQLQIQQQIQMQLAVGLVGRGVIDPALVLSVSS